MMIPGPGRGQWAVADTSGTVIINSVTNYGPNGYLAISSDLYLSADAGAQWNMVTPMFDNIPLLGIWLDAHFPSTSSGIMVGAYDFNNQYSIIRSMDGGHTWIPIEVPGSLTPPWPRRYNAVHFPSANVGYAVGTNGRITKTVNGGATWTNLATGTANEIHSVHFFTNSNGLVAGDDILLRTSTGGTSWTNALAVEGRHVLAANGNHLVAVGPFMCHVSADAGQTWTSSPAPFGGARDIHVIDATTYVVVDNEKVFITHTAGQYWTTADLPVESDLQAVHFLSPTNGCIVGKTGNRSLILHTTSGPGVGLPYATISHSETVGCGTTTCQLELNGADPAWSVTWFLDGTAVGSGPSASVDLNTGGTVLFEAHVSNGTHTAVIPLQTTIEVFQPFSVETSGDVVICFGRADTLSVTMPPGSTVTWEPATGLSNPHVAQPVVSGLDATTTYTATVQNGPCTATGEMTVFQEPEIPLDDWSSIYEGPSWRRFVFVDPYNGFVFNTDSVHRTTDGGNTWTSHHVPQYEYSQPCMWDPWHGYVESDTWGLQVTYNGWETYQTIPGSQIYGGSYHKNVFFKSRDTLFVHIRAQYGTGLHHIMRSTDSGLSWELLDQTFNYLNYLAFPGGDVVLAGCGAGTNSGRIYRSGDIGNTWQQITMPHDFHGTASMAHNSTGTLYATARADLWRSDDLGLTWTKNIAGNNNGSAPDGSVAFHGPVTGYAVLYAKLWQTVNNGDCWQFMNLDLSNKSQVDCLENGTCFLGWEPPGMPGATKLYRNQPLGPVVRFSAMDTVCMGASVQLNNNSVGYTVFEWTIDGAFHSGEAHPGPVVLEPGDHTITLRGANSGDTATFSLPVHVLAPMPGTELNLLNDVCWVGPTVTLEASSPGPVLTYAWYEIQMGTGSTYLKGYAPDSLAVSVTTTARGYYAVPIVGPGCPGLPSDTIVIHSTNPVPNINPIGGPIEVCTMFQPVTTAYQTSHNPSGGYDGSDILGFLWTLEPTQAGILVPDSNTCEVIWSPNYRGNASLKCHPIDSCGIAPPRTKTIAVDTGNYVVIQPVGLTVNLGDPFSLSVEPLWPVSGDGQWYRDGFQLGSGLTYSVAAATATHGGTYRWKGYSGSSICGFFYSDTAVVIVSTPTAAGTSDQELPQVLSVAPNPFREKISVQLPMLATPGIMTVHDATGRLLLEQKVEGGPSRRLEMDLAHLGPNVLFIRVRTADEYYWARIIKVP